VVILAPAYSALQNIFVDDEKEAKAESKELLNAGQ